MECESQDESILASVSSFPFATAAFFLLHPQVSNRLLHIPMKFFPMNFACLKRVHTFPLTLCFVFPKRMKMISIMPGYVPNFAPTLDQLKSVFDSFIYRPH